MNKYLVKIHPIVKVLRQIIKNKVSEPTKTRKKLKPIRPEAMKMSINRCNNFYQT
jgi:hypothetical protein